MPTTDCMLLEIEGAQHELLQEPDAIRDDVLDEIRTFLHAL